MTDRATGRHGRPLTPRPQLNGRTRRRAATRDGDFNRKEVADVFQGTIHRSIHDDRVRDIHRRVVEAQRRDAARAWNVARRPAPRSIRRSIGRSVVRVGEVIAAERGRPVASQ